MSNAALRSRNISTVTMLLSNTSNASLTKLKNHGLCAVIFFVYILRWLKQYITGHMHIESSQHYLFCDFNQLDFKITDHNKTSVQQTPGIKFGKIKYLANAPKDNATDITSRPTDPTERDNNLVFIHLHHTFSYIIITSRRSL